MSAFLPFKVDNLTTLVYKKQPGPGSGCYFDETGKNERNVILMNTINQWWETLSAAHQVFWFIAIVFSVLFFIQFILLLIGFESDDVGVDHDGDMHVAEHEFSALSVRSIIAFFTFFGWTGVLTMNNHVSVWLAVALSVVAGLAAMFIVAYLMFKFAQLEQSGTLNLYNALDQPGEVYLTIPGHGKGKGKVHLQVEGTIREMDAVTDGEALKTGMQVKVTEILDDNVLKVEYLAELEEKRHPPLP